MVKRLFAQHCEQRRNRGSGSCRLSGSDRVKPLSEKHTRGPVKVCCIDGDRKHCARLAALGLYPGNDIELIQPANGNECVIKVHGGTLSIDRDTTRKILITD